ncbi:MAG: Dabb family protein [Pseudomonadota bacterium]
MICHIVMLNLPADHDSTALQAIMGGISTLRDKIPGFDGFTHGPNLDFEGLSPDCSYGFMCRFRDADASQRYLDNAEHGALGQQLIGMCTGGIDGIRVVDLDLAAVSGSAVQ